VNTNPQWVVTPGEEKKEKRKEKRKKERKEKSLQ
jgi:hypothetical protein